MSRLTWKMLGGTFPFIAVFMTTNTATHPKLTLVMIGLGILWANAVGYIEGQLRSIK